MLNSNTEGETNAFVEDEGEDEEEDKGTEENPLNHLKTISKLKPARRKRFPWSESLDRYFTFVNFLMALHVWIASFNLIKFEIPLILHCWIKNGGANLLELDLYFSSLCIAFFTLQLSFVWLWVFLSHRCVLSLVQNFDMSLYKATCHTGCP